ncbi:hypothetical protein IGI86_002618 [Enterococcus sp. AZ188]|uniref:hypothetical protein n=1 Tax=Enterococcus sp. AZ188 TaxID=2774678 RepID=UPI003D2FB028
MRKTQKKTIFVFFLLSLFFLDPMVGHGQNLESTNTVAKLGFTGVYDSPLSPIPQPPNGVQSEKDSIEKLYSSKKALPKLSDSTDVKSKLLGIIILLVLLFLLLTKRKEELKNEKDSISNNDVFNGNTFN